MDNQIIRTWDHLNHIPPSYNTQKSLIVSITIPAKNFSIIEDEIRMINCKYYIFTDSIILLFLLSLLLLLLLLVFGCFRLTKRKNNIKKILLKRDFRREKEKKVLFWYDQRPIRLTVCKCIYTFWTFTSAYCHHQSQGLRIGKGCFDFWGVNI